MKEEQWFVNKDNPQHQRRFRAVQLTAEMTEEPDKTPAWLRERFEANEKKNWWCTPSVVGCNCAIIMEHGSLTPRQVVFCGDYIILSEGGVLTEIPEEYFNEWYIPVEEEKSEPEGMTYPEALAEMIVHPGKAYRRKSWSKDYSIALLSVGFHGKRLIGCRSSMPTTDEFIADENELFATDWVEVET